MTYSQAHNALTEIKALLISNGQFKTSYTIVYAAILNKIAALAQSEKLSKK